jgi:CRP-like cAMP-binding protein
MEWKLLGVLPESERDAILQRARERQFAKGDPIIHEGDPGDALHLISHGHVAVRLATPDGDSCIIRIIPPGGWFGELAMLSPSERMATVWALDRVTTLAIDRSTIDEVRVRIPEFDKVFVNALVAEVRRLSFALLEAHFLPVDQRVLRRLSELAALYGTPNGKGENSGVTLPLTQEELAEVAGTTRPTVNKILQRAADTGLLALRRGHVTILDRARLAELAR